MPRHWHKTQWRPLRAALAMLVLATVAVLAVSPATALVCEGIDLDDGCLFTITGGDTPDPDDGYAVTNANGVPMWDFVRARDLQAIGYPISQRWADGPFTLQAFQKVILQWDPGKSRMNYYNTLDVLANRYPEVELPNVPPHQVLESDRGADFATITRNHLALLDQNAAIKERFLGEPDWLNLYGLPIRYEEREVNGHLQGLQMLRAQRTVFVIWNVPAPGVTVGRVNLQNVPDKVKKLSNVIIPDAAKAPVTPDVVPGLRSATQPTPSPSPVRAPASDREALTMLYHATDGPNWESNRNWLTAASLDEWYGVTTDSKGQVTALRLSRNGLAGNVPPVLGSLSSLRELHLWENQLRGAIPPELSRLTNLETLYLDGNQLSGAIPAELGNLMNLEGLSLDGNQLRGAIPAELGNLMNLFVLALANNQLAGAIPAGLGRLTNLEALYLEANQLRGPIPAELGNLSNLESLVLAENQLTGEIPSSLGRLTNLNELRLNSNELAGAIPSQLGRLANLRVLNVSGNQLRGAIPSEFGGLIRLRELRLGGRNQLTGCIPGGLRAVLMSDLATLGLAFCGPGERSPDEAVLLALYHATYGPGWTNNANWLTEAPLAEWHGVTTDAAGRVTELRLGGNSLEGLFPPDLGRLSELQVLVLSVNYGLQGKIPPELGRLANLQELHLVGSGLTGPIPSELGGLTNLQSLRLAGNRLSGSIPPELGHLVDLRELWLPNNQLTGEIPSELGNLANLVELWLSGNHLNGSIPSELGGLSKLTLLWLDDNQLRDQIPPHLGNLVNLEWLGLSDNELTGTIPPTLASLANLVVLLLNGNQLSGAIPPELGNLAKLELLGLADNQLSGTIPSTLGQLDNLSRLELQHNRLSGMIPSELSNLSNLAVLKLGGGNQLTGCIPEELRDVEDSDLAEIGLPLCEAT